MNAAVLSKSDRLKRVLRVLKHGGAYSTREIIRAANVCSVSAIVSELRQNGYQIGCKRKGNIWRYMIESKA